MCGSKKASAPAQPTPTPATAVADPRALTEFVASAR